MTKLRLIQGKGDPTANPPTGASDGDLYHLGNDFITQGGVANKAGGDCLVEESDTPGMHVKVAAGTVYVLNAAWTENSEEPKYYQVVRDAETTGVSISSNASGSTRIDLICQEIDKVTSPNDDADNVVPITVVEGTPGAGTPATPDNHEVLAEVTVVDSETTITNSEISDARKQVTFRKFKKIQSVTSGSTPTPDAADDVFEITALATNPTFGSPTGDLADGQSLIIRIKDNGTSRTLSWNAIYRAVGVDLPTATTVNKWLYLGFIYNDTDTKLDLVALTEEA